MRPEKFTLKARLASFRFAFRGLASLIRNEHNSRIHLFATILVIAAGIILKINSYDWCIIIIVTGLVFACELINSAVESLGDQPGPGYSEFIKRAKDYSAAAVLVSAVIAVACGLIIFIPKVLSIITPK